MSNNNQLDSPSIKKSFSQQEIDLADESEYIDPLKIYAEEAFVGEDEFDSDQVQLPFELKQIEKSSPPPSFPKVEISDHKVITKQEGKYYNVIVISLIITKAINKNNKKRNRPGKLGVEGSCLNFTNENNELIASWDINSEITGCTKDKKQLIFGFGASQYIFEAKKKGDINELHSKILEIKEQKIDNNSFPQEVNSKPSFQPDVEKLPSVKNENFQEFYYKSIFSFESSAEDELSFVENECFVFIESVDENWWKMKNVTTGQIGLVPCSYLSSEEFVSEEHYDAQENVTSPEYTRTPRNNEPIEAIKTSDTGFSYVPMNSSKTQKLGEINRKEQMAEESQQPNNEFVSKTNAEFSYVPMDSLVSHKLDEIKKKDQKAEEPRQSNIVLSKPPSLPSRTIVPEKTVFVEEPGVNMAKNALDKGTKPPIFSRPTSKISFEPAKMLPNIDSVKPLPASSCSAINSDSDTTKEVPKNTRLWSDTSGSFKVEAEILGIYEDKVRLFKLNGVKIAVPIEKLSDQDKKFIEEYKEMQSKETFLFNGFNWAVFFETCGIYKKDSEKYAVSFVKEKMEKDSIPSLSRNILKDFKIPEGDIIKILNKIEMNKKKTSRIETKPTSLVSSIPQRAANPGPSLFPENKISSNDIDAEKDLIIRLNKMQQMKRDEDYARKLQDEENKKSEMYSATNLPKLPIKPSKSLNSMEINQSNPSGTSLSQEKFESSLMMENSNTNNNASDKTLRRGRVSNPLRAVSSTNANEKLSQSASIPRNESSGTMMTPLIALPTSITQIPIRVSNGSPEKPKPSQNMFKRVPEVTPHNDTSSSLFAGVPLPNNQMSNIISGSLDNQAFPSSSGPSKILTSGSVPQNKIASGDFYNPIQFQPSSSYQYSLNDSSGLFAGVPLPISPNNSFRAPADMNSSYGFGVRNENQNSFNNPMTPHTNITSGSNSFNNSGFGQPYSNAQYNAPILGTQNAQYLNFKEDIHEITQRTNHLGQTETLPSFGSVISNQFGSGPNPNINPEASYGLSSSGGNNLMGIQAQHSPINSMGMNFVQQNNTTNNLIGPQNPSVMGRSSQNNPGFNRNGTSAFPGGISSFNPMDEYNNNNNNNYNKWNK